MTEISAAEAAEAAETSDAAAAAGLDGVPWAVGGATGVGSLPGTDPLEAARTVAGELPDLPHLAELPARGPGGDLVGRTAAAVLVGLEVDVQPSGWRLVPRPGIDARRARTMLGHDLDAFEEALDGYAGPAKLQVCGPWTLAAAVETSRGGPALADPGARRDLAASLAEGVTAQVEQVRRRLPGVRVLVQLDEPSLPAVLAGGIPTASGFSRIGAVEPSDAQDGLRPVLDAVVAAGGWPLVHCCAADVPLRLLHDAGARAVSLDPALLADDRDEDLGELVEAGLALLLGCVPTTEPPATRTGPVSATDLVAPVRERWRRIGLDADLLATRTAATPACGLAAASPTWARRALALAVEAGRALADA